MARTRVSRRDVRLCHTRHSDIPDRLPYPCYFLCGECGWLEDGPVAHPLRSVADEAHEPGPCPSCQAKSWVDLRKQTIAQTYREAEVLDATMRNDRARRYGLWLGASFGVVTLGGVVAELPRPPELLGLPVPLVLPVLLGLGLVAWLITGTAIAAIIRRVQPGRAGRCRWRRALPRPIAVSGGNRAVADRAPVEGVVEGETVLQTPLGREPCVAWAVQVWSGDHLLLDEQHHAPLTIDGVRVPSDTVGLDFATRRQRYPSGNDEAFQRFMAQRGLSPHDSSLRIYESHLVSGVPAALHRGRGRDSGGLVLSQAPRALAS